MGFDLVSRILFPTPSASYGIDSFPEELIWVPKTLDPKTCSPEDCVPCLFLPYSSARFLVFYLHSNAEDIGRCHAFCSSLRAQFQVHVLAVEYPGYGICPGGPCDEHRVTENAFAAFRFVREVLCWPLDSILILGRSIGCGPAISLAVRYQVSGVIVVSPMLSVKEVCKDAIGPLAYMVDERFPNKDRVPLIRSPLLVVHGQKDMMIPVRHGVELYGACRSRKLLICPKDMEHNTNLLANVTYFVLPMLQFFSLPDYCFEDINVPKWAYDKRLSPLYYSNSSVENPIPTTALGPGDSTADYCETPQQPTVGCLACPAMSGPGVISGTQDRGFIDAPAESLNRWLFGHKVAISTGPAKQSWATNGEPEATTQTGANGPANDSLPTVGARSGLASSMNPRASAAPPQPGCWVEDDRGVTSASHVGAAIPRVVPPPGAAMADPAPPPLRGAAGFSGPHAQPLPQTPLTPPIPNQSQDQALTTPSAPGTSDPSNQETGIPTPPWGPSVAPCEPRRPLPCEPGAGEGAAAQPVATSPPRASSPSTSLKLLTPVDLVEIVEDLERHFASESRRREDMSEGGPRVPPASAPCTPLGQWRSLPAVDKGSAADLMLKYGSGSLTMQMPLSSTPRMAPSERRV